MIRVRTGSRLHFGLMMDDSARPFGGIGLMIDKPGIAIEFRRASTWSATGLLAERALKIARRVAETLPNNVVFPIDLEIKTSAPEHIGLGTGTQLSLAVGGGITRTYGVPNANPEATALTLHRGRRSLVGVHGFMHGGFIVDGGAGVERGDFPEEWRVVIAIPLRQPGVHGMAEDTAFEGLRFQGKQTQPANSLALLVHERFIPALRGKRFGDFSEALFEYNSKIGEAFASVQGGRYASSEVAALVGSIRKSGVHGVGQSSWGPTVFAVTEHQDAAETLAADIADAWGLPSGITICKGLNRGATIEVNDAD